MIGITSRMLPARQRGIALLGLLALLGAAVIFAYVAGLNRSASSMAQARAQKTAIALAQAKEALIAYAVTYADDPSRTANLVPGFLPCPVSPTSNNEGVAASPCGGTLISQLGRLPWRTLDLGPITDGSGECLWYAVSGRYKSSPNGVTTSAATSNMMNWDANGQFNVMDANGTSYLAGSTTDPSTNAVAVIFAPGAPLSGQNRAPVPGIATPACGGNSTAAAYLESTNGINNSVVSGTAGALSTLIAGTSSDTFNDQLVYVTRADVWNAIKKRSDFQNKLRALTSRVAGCVRTYGQNNGSPVDPADRRLPWASPVLLANYAVDANYADASGNMQGRLPYSVGTSKSSPPVNLPSGSSLLSACGYTSQELDWYENWKDHLFYAIATNFQPSATPFVVCGTCLKVESAGNYAAVVIFAGERLPGQFRNTAANKGDVTNYLEGQNAINTGGNGSNYQAAASSTFNDIVYAIDTNLLVTSVP
jgi:hypothetical protein